MMYGGKYYWMQPDGVESLDEGYMNVRVYRELDGTLTGYNSQGFMTTCEFTAILRMSLMGGMNLSGDIFMYAQGGAEVIGECTVDPATSKAGNPVASYLIPDQTKWLRDTTVTKDTPAKFLIEECADAIKTGEGTNLADGYYARRIGYSPVKAQADGGLGSYECCYGYTRNEWAAGVGKRVRIALRFRGYANSTYCSPRNWNANYSASNTYRNNGGSAKECGHRFRRFSVGPEKQTVARTRPEAANTKDLRGGGAPVVSATGKRPMAQPEPRENQ